jgi:hypothetical protein
MQNEDKIIMGQYNGFVYVSAEKANISAIFTQTKATYAQYVSNQSIVFKKSTIILPQKCYKKEIKTLASEVRRFLKMFFFFFQGVCRLRLGQQAHCQDGPHQRVLQLGPGRRGQFWDLKLKTNIQNSILAGNSPM